jgi:Protein of unknown function (DUF2939)
MLAGAYTLSPLWTAWSIREAVKSGDHTYLAKSIDWANVRMTLAASLETAALTTSDDKQAGNGVAAPRASLWQRFKGWASRSMIQSFVTSNVTPEGLPRLFGIGKTYRSYVHGDVEQERTLANLPDRVRKFWARVKRAEFQSLTRFEIDFLDKHNRSRMYVGTLELRDWGWRLTELRVRQRLPQTAPMRSAALL